MKATVKDVGKYGMITDINPNDLPIEAWTYTRNMRHLGTRCESMQGRTVLYDPDDDLSYFEGLYLVPLDTETDTDFIFPYTATSDHAGEKIGKLSGKTASDITRAAGDYTGGEYDLWTGCNFNGIAVLTNNTDAPQWTTGSACQNMIYSGSNDWENPTGASPGSEEPYVCKVIRKYKNFLFALNITDNGTNYPNMIHWSSPADPGTMPSSWDYASTTEESGRTVLADSAGEVLDALTLNETLIIYKEDMTYSCTFVGGTYVFQIRPLFNDYGLYTSECVVDIGGRHICLGRTSVYMHDGHKIEVISSDKIENYLFPRIDPDEYRRTFLVHNAPKNEVLICYPLANSSNYSCDEALSYNYRYGTWTRYASINRTYHMTLGAIGATYTDTWAAHKKAVTGVSNANPAVVTSASHGFLRNDKVYADNFASPMDTYLNGNTFTVRTVANNTFQLASTDSTGWGSYAAPTPDTDYFSLTWNSEETQTWTGRLYSPVADSLVGIGTEIYEYNKGPYLAGFSTSLHQLLKTNINLGLEDEWHQIKAVYPHASGGTMLIRVGSMSFVNDDNISWGDWQTFDPDTDKKIDCRSTGALHAIEFRMQSSLEELQFNGYTIHYEKAGAR